jgi:hypothetical protein
VTATVITDEVRGVDATVDGDRLLVDAAALPQVIGWQLELEGLCRGDVCVPVRDRDALVVGDQVDVAVVAHALQRQVVVDLGERVVAIALDSEGRRQALDERHAPAFTLPDLDGRLHSLEEWHGRKKLLIAFSTW